MGNNKSTVNREDDHPISFGNNNYPLLSRGTLNIESSITDTKNPFFPRLIKNSKEGDDLLSLSKKQLESGDLSTLRTDVIHSNKTTWNDDTDLLSVNEYQANRTKLEEITSFLQEGEIHNKSKGRNKRARLIEHRKEITIHLEKRRSVRKKAYTMELNKMFRKIAIQLHTYTNIGNDICDFSEMSLIFKDPNCSKLPVSISIYFGTAFTLPKLYCAYYKEYFTPPSIDEIASFLGIIFERMELPFECSVITLIYIERLIVIVR